MHHRQTTTNIHTNTHKHTQRVCVMDQNSNPFHSSFFATSGATVVVVVITFGTDLDPSVPPETRVVLVRSWSPTPPPFVSPSLACGATHQQQTVLLLCSQSRMPPSDKTSPPTFPVVAGRSPLHEFRDTTVQFHHRPSMLDHGHHSRISLFGSFGLVRRPLLPNPSIASFPPTADLRRTRRYNSPQSSETDSTWHGMALHHTTTHG